MFLTRCMGFGFLGFLDAVQGTVIFTNHSQALDQGRAGNKGDRKSDLHTVECRRGQTGGTPTTTQPNFIQWGVGEGRQE